MHYLYFLFVDFMSKVFLSCIENRTEFKQKKKDLEIENRTEFKQKKDLE